MIRIVTMIMSRRKLSVKLSMSALLFRVQHVVVLRTKYFCQLLDGRWTLMNRGKEGDVLVFALIGGLDKGVLTKDSDATNTKT